MLNTKLLRLICVYFCFVPQDLQNLKSDSTSQPQEEQYFLLALFSSEFMCCIIFVKSADSVHWLISKALVAAKGRSLSATAKY